MRKVVIIGANGQLGTDLVKELGGQQTSFQVIPLTHKEIEICDHAGTREILTRLEPDVVINTAAYHQVDECEDNPEKAFQVNAIAVRSLAWVCRNLDAVLVHMSTDYVFGGDQNRRTPYTKDDPPWPVNVYGVSKLAGECFVRSLCPKHFIVRSSGLYGVAGSSGKGGNFVELMLHLAHEGRAIKVVNDQTLTPTSTRALAKQIVALIQTDAYGVYHATCQGACTWFDFAAEIFRQSDLNPSLTSQTTAESGARATRPAYAVLENAALQRIGIDHMPRWQSALRTYLDERKMEGAPARTV